MGCIKKQIQFKVQERQDLREKLRDRRLFKEDFQLPRDDHVAFLHLNDCEELAEFWNSTVAKGYSRSDSASLVMQIWRIWREGIWGRTALMIFIYLLAYYLNNVIVIQIMCA